MKDISGISRAGEVVRFGGSGRDCPCICTRPATNTTNIDIDPKQLPTQVIIFDHTRPVAEELFPSLDMFLL